METQLLSSQGFAEPPQIQLAWNERDIAAHTHSLCSFHPIICMASHILVMSDE